MLAMLAALAYASYAGIIFNFGNLSPGGTGGGGAVEEKTVNRRLIVCSVGCCGSWGTVKPLQSSSATLKSDVTKRCNKDHEFDHNILSDNENGHGKHPLLQHILTCNDWVTFYCKVQPGSRKARHEESTGTLLR